MPVIPLSVVKALKNKDLWYYAGVVGVDELGKKLRTEEKQALDQAMLRIAQDDMLSGDQRLKYELRLDLEAGKLHCTFLLACSVSSSISLAELRQTLDLELTEHDQMLLESS